jgi:tetratricopeptide (TPR) repeat protein
MSQTKGKSPNEEPAWIKDWRRLYKKKFSTSEDPAEYERDSPFNFKEVKNWVESEAAKGNIPPNVVKQLLDAAKKREGTVTKIPPYESPVTFRLLKNWSKRLEAAVPQVVRLEDDKKQGGEGFRLEYPPYIITRRMGELNAATGPIPGPDDTHYYHIAFDSLFVYFVNRIGEVSARLFDSRNIKESEGFKELFAQNLERNPGIYKYFRDVFYHFMFYGNKHLKDNNLLEMLGMELLVNHLGFLPPLEFDAYLLFSKGSLMMNDAIGLFIMGHEYAHIILHLEAESFSEYNSKINKSFQQEFQADELGLMLTRNCIQQTNPKEVMSSLFCFAGIEIALNCLYVIDRLRGILDGSDGPTVYESHPPTKQRMEKIRKFMLSYCEKGIIPEWTSDLLDAIDDVFQKLGDRLAGEISNNHYVLDFLRAKKERIEGLKNEARNLVQKKADLQQKNGSPDPEIDNNIISLCKRILAEEPNDVFILFMLGSLYLESYQDDTALECFMKIIGITGRDCLENKPFDHLRCYASWYFAGYCYTQKVLSIISSSGGNPNPEQEKRIAKLFDDAIIHFETALPHYNHNGQAFYYYAVALSYKKRYLEAIKNFDKALEYTPGNPQILLARQMSLEKLRGT